MIIPIVIFTAIIVVVTTAYFAINWEMSCPFIEVKAPNRHNNDHPIATASVSDQNKFQVLVDFEGNGRVIFEEEFTYEAMYAKVVEFLSRCHSKNEFAMIVDYFTNDLLEAVKNHLVFSPIYSYTLDGYNEIILEGSLSVDFEKLASSKYFRCKKRKTWDPPEFLHPSPPNIRSRSSIWDEVEIERPEEILKEMSKDKLVAVKGDLNMRYFAQFYVALRECMIGTEDLSSSQHPIEGNAYIFTSPETQSKHSVLYTIESRTASNHAVLNLDLTNGQQSHTIESIREEGPKYYYLIIAIDWSSELDIVSTAFKVNSISKIRIEFGKLFTQFNELLTILKEQEFTELALHSIYSPESDKLKYFFQDLTRTPWWKNLKGLNYSQLSFETISNFFCRLPENLHTLHLNKCDENYLRIDIKPIDSIKKIIFHPNCGKSDFQFSIQNLLEIFPKTESLELSFSDSLEIAEIEHEKNKYKEIRAKMLKEMGDAVKMNENQQRKEARTEVNRDYYLLDETAIKHSLFEKQKGRMKSIESEFKLVNYLMRTKLSSVTIRLFNGSIKWKKQGNQIFYESLFKNFISTECKNE